MINRVLTPEQIEHFVEKGYVHVKEAFSPEQAQLAQSYLWRKLEEKADIVRNDKSTWKEDMVNMREVYRDDSFDRCNSVRFADAVEDLVGEGRVQQRFVYGDTDQLPGWGWWPVNFSYGASSPWTVPTNGWHWDGIQFRHYIDAPDQGLLCLCLFSDIAPRGGSTLVVEGSHRPVANYLSRYPDGIEIKDAIPEFMSENRYFSELTGRSGEALSAEERIDKYMNNTRTEEDGSTLRVVETPGNAGDVYLCHPFLIHAASPNHSGKTRFMCNRTSPLTEKMQLNRANTAEESPLERSIRQVL